MFSILIYIYRVRLHVVLHLYYISFIQHLLIDIYSKLASRQQFPFESIVSSIALLPYLVQLGP